MFTILSGCSSVKLSPCFSQMLWSTQQVSAIFLLSSSLRSFLFRRHLHRPFKSPKIHLYNRLCTGEPVIVGLLFMGQSASVRKGLHEPILHGVCWTTYQVMSNITATDVHFVLPK